MLKDCTNAGGPPVLKTFQRRPKQPAASGPGTTPAGQQHGDQGPPRRGAPEASGRTYTPELTNLEGSADNGATDSAVGCPGGYLKCLKNRRITLIVPSATALEAPSRPSKSNRDRKHFERYWAVVTQLKAQIAEIDAFELTVEDPRPSPQPERRGRRVESRNQHINVTDGGRVPTGRAAQGGPHVTRRPADVARTAAPAAQAEKAALGAAAVPAPSAAGRSVSGGGSIGDNRCGGPRRSGAPAASASDLVPAGTFRSSLDSGAFSHAADELARDVQRLGFSGSVATRSTAAATGVTISGAAAAAHGPAGSSGHGTTDFQEPGLHRERSPERELDGEAATRASLSSCRDSAGAVIEAPGSRGCNRPSPLSSVLPLGVDAVGISAPPAQLPGPSGAEREPRRTGSRASAPRPLSFGAPAAIEQPAAPLPTVEARRQSRPQSRPPMPRLSVGFRATTGDQEPSAKAEREAQQREMEEWPLELQQENVEMEDLEDGQEQVEQQQQDVADGEEWQDGERQQSDQQQVQQDGARETGDDDAAGELEGYPPAERPGLRLRSASQQEAAVATTAEEDELEGEAQAGCACSSLAAQMQQPHSAGMRSESRPGADAAAVVAAEATAAAAVAASQETAISGLAASSSAAAEDDGPLVVGAVQVEAPAASARRSSAAAALTPLQLLLHCCGQEPSLELHVLPTMDEIIDMLLLATVTSAGSSVPDPDGVAADAAARAAGAAGRGRGRGRKAGGAGAAKGPSTKRPPLVKVGEGSYGEAWRLGGGGGQGGGSSMVIKVVPIEGDMVFNGGPQKTAGDMMSETVMSRELSALGLAAGEVLSGDGGGGAASANWSAGFVRMHAVAVCRGPYSKDLVKAWEKWDKQHGSENEPVSELPPDQLYWVIAMEDSGTDLEKYVLTSWDQLRSVLLQTAVGLAVAEASLCFEHRDLHWGNVLVRPAGERPDCRPDGSLGARLQGREMRVASCGVAATIIDFTASRLQAPDGTLVFCDLSQDPAVFEGTQGEVQFDTYRWMRSLVDNDWSSKCPATNCLWLSYMAEVLSKRFGSGGGGGAGKGVRLSAAHKRQLREFRKRAVAYGSCSELVWDELFEGLLRAND